MIEYVDELATCNVVNFFLISSWRLSVANVPFFQCALDVESTGLYAWSSNFKSTRRAELLQVEDTFFCSLVYTTLHSLQSTVPTRAETITLIFLFLYK